MWRRTVNQAALAVAILAAPASRPVQAASLPSPIELMTKVDAAQKDLRSLRADFVQHSRVKLFRQQISSEGRLQYQKGDPARLRWEYLKPDPSTMLLVGDKVQLKMGTRPPQVIDTGKDPMLRAIFTQLRLWLGQGSLREAESEYEISVAGSVDQPALVLVPKAQSPLQRVFSRIELHLDGKTMLLRRLMMVEQSGDEKEIIFGKLDRNIEISASQFQ
ncbi:MAG: outer membrane lipoprotein carrier protein LolA [Myxococcales bacterium]|nr:outer membrane lipoprotein carrier protein LolA [Myxococcales bacterium]